MIAEELNMDKNSETNCNNRFEREKSAFQNGPKESDSF
jgi:hypothetical protein